MVRAFVRPQRFGELVQVALKDRFDPVRSEPDAMVGDPTLREVVGPDLLSSVSGAHLAAALRSELGVLLGLGLIVEPGAQDAEGPLLVLQLRFLVLAGDCLLYTSDAADE